MLTDITVRALKPRAKPFKKSDRDGLYLYVTPAGPKNQKGSKLWRMKYQFEGHEQRLTFGAYPDVTLAEARARCQAARQQLREKINPAAAHRTGNNAPTIDAPPSGQPTFEVLAREWHAKQRAAWGERHAQDVLDCLEKDVFPAIGSLPLSTITPPLVYVVVHAIELRGAVETAHRVRQRISATFVYGIARGLCDTDPAATIRGALAPVVKGRMPAIVELDGLREMLTLAEDQRAHPVTKLGLRLLALTVVRPGELRGARWEEFDLANGRPVWRIGADRMKTKQAHIVPLAAAAVDVIEAARPLTGRCPFLFPNARWPHKPMTENAIGYLLNRAGYHGHHTPHGWRSSFSSIMNERHPEEGDAIEACLAHDVPGVRGRYLRSSFNGRRRELLAEWAGLLVGGLPPAAKLLEGPRR
jgi:integrase